MKDETMRCGWVGACEEEIKYHDERWCRPVHDERELFAMLCLEGQQAGLSWTLILKRESAIRKAFEDFDPERLAQCGEEKLAELLQNPGIIRNKAKIRAAFSNARAFLNVQREFGSFDSYIWGFTKGEVLMNRPSRTDEPVAKSELSERVSADLIKRGFRFAGPVIIYSYLQAIGVINDHVEGCPWKY